MLSSHIGSGPLYSLWDLEKFQPPLPIQALEPRIVERGASRHIYFFLYVKALGLEKILSFGIWKKLREKSGGKTRKT